MTEVSVRELKTHLSEYLRRAKSGEAIVVTNRGQAIASLSQAPRPARTSEEKLRDLEARGVIHRSTERYVVPKKRIRLRGNGPTLSEMILEDRR